MKDAKDASLYEAYLQKYPKGKLADIAKTLIARIGSEQKEAEERAQAEARKAEAAQKAASLAKETPTTVSEEVKEIAYWESIRNSRSKRLFEVYLNKYPQGMFASIARTQIEAIHSVERARKASPTPRPAEPKTAPAPRPAKQAAKTSGDRPPSDKSSGAAVADDTRACKNGDVNACRRDCSRGGRRACMGVKCLNGDSSACSWLRATKGQATGGGGGFGGGSFGRRRGGF